jgi:hypothetical protein
MHGYRALSPNCDPRPSFGLLCRPRPSWPVAALASAAWTRFSLSSWLGRSWTWSNGPIRPLPPGNPQTLSQSASVNISAAELKGLPVVSRGLEGYQRANFQVAIDAYLEEPGRDAELIGLPMMQGYRMGLAELAKGFRHGPWGSDGEPGPIEYEPVEVGERRVICVAAGLWLITEADQPLLMMLRREDHGPGYAVLGVEIMARDRAAAEQLLAGVGQLVWSSQLANARLRQGLDPPGRSALRGARHAGPAGRPSRRTHRQSGRARRHRHLLRGGQSIELAYLRNRIRLPDGSFAPWRSPKGTRLSIRAAYPRWPWSDLVDALLPHGRFLDTQVAPPDQSRNPIGVEIQSYVSGL